MFYIGLSIISLSVLGIVYLIPSIGAIINLYRTIHLLLILIAPLSIFGLYCILNTVFLKITKPNKIITLSICSIISVLCISLLLLNLGLVYEFTNDPPSSYSLDLTKRMNLDVYSTGELLGIEWSDKITQGGVNLVGDGSIIERYGRMNEFNNPYLQAFPSKLTDISTQSAIFLRKVNILDGKIYSRYGDEYLGDIAPVIHTKNKLYSNGDSEIYLWSVYGFTMGEQFKISIIIVCLNAGNLFECTIKSIFSQTYQNIEIIVIDGGSKDETIDVVNEYIDWLNVFISEPDNGIYDAMNKGISYASGDVVYFLNCGDYLSDVDVINNVVNFFLKNPDFPIIYGDSIEYNFNGVQIYKKNFQKSIIHLVTDVGYAIRQFLPSGNYSSLKINGRLILNINYFQITIGFLIQYLKKEMKLVYVDIPICYYLIGGFSQSKYRDYSAERLHIILKNINKLLNLKLICKYPKEYAYLLVLIFWLSFHSIRAFIFRSGN